MVFTKGHKPFNTGKNRVLSEATRKRISYKLKKLYNSPEKHPQYKGEILRSGYFYIKQPSHPHAGKQKYVAVHRLVMEKHLGRFLKPTEVVHHIDHNPLNNAIENLKLCSGHGQHIVEEHPDVMKKMWDLSTGRKPNKKQLEALAKGRRYWARKK
jgi:hypothetical protein